MSARRRIAPLWAIAITASAVFAANGARSYVAAGDELARSRTLLEDAERKADEIRRLRGEEQRVASNERPPQDVVASINRTLTEVGVRSDRLRGLETVGDSSFGPRGVGAGRYRRQVVAATLEELTPAELGRFLARWRVDQPIWTPTRVELFHVRTQPAPARLYSARVELAAVYLSDDLEGSSQ